MAIKYLKKSPKTSSTDDTKTTEIVKGLLKDIETNKEQACIDLTKKFDKYDGEIIVSKERIEEIKKTLDQKTKDDIQFSHERVRKFAEAQLKNYGQDFETELSPGLFAGQKLVPVNTAGCYIPGGRYAHIASAVMSVTTAKVAGVKNIIACSPPKEGVGAHPTIVYTANLCGADVILNLGGVPGVASMTNGLFKNPPADIIVGPGNQFVTAAKQWATKFQVAIDLPAGPSELLVAADATSNPNYVAADLLSQAEHGPDSQVVLVSTSSSLIEAVRKAIDVQLEQLPRKEIATQALENSKAILVASDAAAIDLINAYAPEHYIIMTENEQDYIDGVQNAGSVFIGAYTPESAGDYASGTNHTLPTNGYARQYSGVNLDSFMKAITFQKITDNGLQKLGPAIEIMATAEGLEAHKNAISIRLKDLL